MPGASRQRSSPHGTARHHRAVLLRRRLNWMEEAFAHWLPRGTALVQHARGHRARGAGVAAVSAVAALTISDPFGLVALVRCRARLTQPATGADLPAAQLPLLRGAVARSAQLNFPPTRRYLAGHVPRPGLDRSPQRPDAGLAGREAPPARHLRVLAVLPRLQPGACLGVLLVLGVVGLRPFPLFWACPASDLHQPVANAQAAGRSITCLAQPCAGADRYAFIFVASESGSTWGPGAQALRAKRCCAAGLKVPCEQPGGIWVCRLVRNRSLLLAASRRRRKPERRACGSQRASLNTIARRSRRLAVCRAWASATRQFKEPSAPTPRRLSRRAY